MKTLILSLAVLFASMNPVSQKELSIENEENYFGAGIYGTFVNNSNTHNIGIGQRGSECWYCNQFCESNNIGKGKEQTLYSEIKTSGLCIGETYKYLDFNIYTYDQNGKSAILTEARIKIDGVKCYLYVGNITVEQLWVPAITKVEFTVNVADKEGKVVIESATMNVTLS